MKQSISTPVAAAIIVLVVFLIGFGIFVHSQSSSAPVAQSTQTDQTSLPAGKSLMPPKQ